MRVSRNDYSKSVPGLKPEDLGGKRAAILAVQDVEDVSFGKDETGKEQRRLAVRFSEFPEKRYYLNMTGYDAITSQFGDETDDWKGQRVPVHVVKAPNPKLNGKLQDALHVVDPNDWDDAFVASRVTRGRPAGTGSGRKAAKSRR